MSSDRRPRYLQDVLDAIADVRMFTDGMDLQAYLSNRLVQAAVERKLQIVTEALIRIGRREMELLCPGVDWQSARDMGNFLRHEYERVSNEVVWETVLNDLPELEQAAKTALLSLETGS